MPHLRPLNVCTYVDKWPIDYSSSVLIAYLFHCAPICQRFLSVRRNACTLLYKKKTTQNNNNNKRWDGCTALGSADTSSSSQHCTAYGAYLLSSPLAGCSAALETQYWSDPCVTGSQCSIAIEPARKTTRKQPQTATPSALTLARGTPEQNAPRFATGLAEPSTLPSRAALAPVTLMAIFRGFCRGIICFVPAKHCWA